MSEFVEYLLVTRPLSTGDGYTFTIASLLGEMLRLVETRFGERDKSYTLLGFEFINDIPQIWFPRGEKQIVIQLGLPCLQEPDRACYQLAHEVVHLLSPTGARNANVLEEGLATHFQVWYLKSVYPSIGWGLGRDLGPGLSSYADAKSAAEALLAVDADAIKKLRAEQPVISHISSELIQRLYPSFPSETANILGSRFQR